MSKHETPMTEAFWQGYARGAYIPEYCLVRPTSHCGVRLVDALILPDEPHHRARFQDYTSLAGRNVIVVQTKAPRMGMYLWGRRFFGTPSDGAGSKKGSLHLVMRPLRRLASTAARVSRGGSLDLRQK